MLEKGTQKGSAEASGELKKECDSDGNAIVAPREKSVERTALDKLYTGIAAKKEEDGEPRTANVGVVELFDGNTKDPIDADNDAGEPPDEETQEQRAYRIRTEVTDFLNKRTPQLIMPAAHRFMQMLEMTLDHFASQEVDPSEAGTWGTEQTNLLKDDVVTFCVKHSIEKASVQRILEKENKNLDAPLSPMIKLDVEADRKADRSP